MLHRGLVSVSFRQNSVDDIIHAASAAGLSCIEWGSDVHLPPGDRELALTVAEKTKAAGLFCCSYGSYFRLGQDAPEMILPYLATAKMLGTNILRIWGGAKNFEEYDKREIDALVLQAKRAAQLAGQQGITLCLELHNWTVTNTYRNALFFVRAVGSDHLKLYWQPNQFQSDAYNLESAKALAPYVTQLHVFNWKGKDKFPLADAIPLWRDYLKAFDGDHCLLLEFMPDGEIASLQKEAQALFSIVNQENEWT